MDELNRNYVEVDLLRIQYPSYIPLYDYFIKDLAKIIDEFADLTEEEYNLCGHSKEDEDEIVE